MLCLNVVLLLQYYVQYVGLFMFLTRCHEFPFPATRGHFRSEPEVAARGRYYCTGLERFWNDFPKKNRVRSGPTHQLP